jgi:hypothetical protein
MTPATPLQIVAAGTRLRVDAWTAEVIGALRERNIRVVLLKGPAVARWLYADDPALRPYSDVDLIVSPVDTKRAQALLGELGFASLWHPALETHALHARPYQRERDGANIDLHRTLHGLQDVPSERAWQAVSTDTDMIQVGNLNVEIPSVPVRVLHLVMHLGHSDYAGTQPWRDLERCLDQSATDEWRAAVAVARQLGVENELAVRLRRLPQGAQLADQFGLTRRGSRYYRLRVAFETGQAPGSVHSIWALTALPDARSRVAYVRGKLLPGEQALRERSALARRGHIGLAAALHIVRIMARLPRTLVAWARHYRE